MMQHAVKLLLLTTIFTFPLYAQKGACTEESIKAESAKAGEPPSIDDYYFFSGALEKPVIGEAERLKAVAPLATERKNVKQDPLKADRIVVAPSGDMAYEYGTGHMSFDETDNGKHHDFTVAYLRVWTSDKGSCTVAATMAQPEGKR